MNIIVVVSDTLRRDHLPCYGADSVIAPNIKAFAERAILFDNCYAASFPTVPTRADLLTGRYTFTYLKWQPLPHSERTLAEVLGEAGYLTCGIVDTPFLLRNGYGYDRGFKDFYWIRGQRYGLENDDVNRQRVLEKDYCAPRTFATAMEWLEWHHEDKFFLYVDTWDPHEPWDPPAYYVKPYYPEYRGQLVNPCYWDWKDDGYTREDLEVAHACYCGEISMVDTWFGHFLDKLETLSLMSSTAIIFLSDHGFYFGEHGVFGKSRFRRFPDILGADVPGGTKWRSPLHQEVTRVPLIAYLPGIEPRRTPTLASLPDVMPTILEVAGETIPSSVQARSLYPTLLGKSDSVHDFVVTSASLLETKGVLTRAVDDAVREVQEVSPSSITNGEWDLLYAMQGEPVELYRTVEDPGHERNLIEEHRDIAETLRRDFVSWLDRVGTAPELLEARQRL